MKTSTQIVVRMRLAQAAAIAQLSALITYAVADMQPVWEPSTQSQNTRWGLYEHALGLLRTMTSDATSYNELAEMTRDMQRRDFGTLTLLRAQMVQSAATAVMDYASVRYGKPADMDVGRSAAHAHNRV